MYITGL
jgi:antitoxin Phd